MPEPSDAPRVLVLDDDALFRSLVRPALEAEGLCVLEAPRAAIARELLLTEAPDVLVVDGLLPDTHGVRFIEQVRAAGSSVPIVFCSAFFRDFATFQHLTKDLSVLRVLNKPVEPSTFARRIRELCDAGAGAREAARAASIALELGHDPRDAEPVALVPGVVAAPAAPARELPEEAVDELTAAAARAPSDAPAQAPRFTRFRLLVLPDTPSFGEFVAGAFADRWVDVQVVAAPEAWASALASERPDVALVSLPRSGVEAHVRAVLAGRKTEAGQRAPLAVVASQADVQSRFVAGRLGAADFLSDASDAGDLVARIYALHARASAPPSRVLVFTGHPLPAQEAEALRAPGLDFEVVHHVDALVTALGAFRPDAVVLGGAHGFGDWASVIRTADGGADPALVVVGAVDASAALAAGIDDVVPTLHAGARAIAARADRVAAARTATSVCPRTRLPMGLPLEQELRARVAHARRTGAAFTVGLVRLLGLDALAATEGVVAVDRAVVAASRLVASRFRLDDLRGRLDRSTFVFGFGGARTFAMEPAVARVLGELAALGVLAQGGRTLPLDACAGLADLDESGHAARLLGLAARRLERAAAAGPGIVRADGL